MPEAEEDDVFHVHLHLIQLGSIDLLRHLFCFWLLESVRRHIYARYSWNNDKRIIICECFKKPQSIIREKFNNRWEIIHKSGKFTLNQCILSEYFEKIGGWERCRCRDWSQYWPTEYAGAGADWTRRSNHSAYLSSHEAATGKYICQIITRVQFAHQKTSKCALHQVKRNA